MLDVVRANAKTGAINLAFSDIGVVGDTKMPRSKLNTEPVAWEYHVSALLVRQANARMEKAQKAAVKAGVMFDHEKEPRVPGTNEMVFAGEVVQIDLKVTTPRTKLDTDALFADLEKAGVRRALIDKLVDRHTHDNRAPHSFTSSLMTE